MSRRDEGEMQSEQVGRVKLPLEVVEIGWQDSFLGRHRVAAARFTLLARNDQRERYERDWIQCGADGVWVFHWRRSARQ